MNSNVSARLRRTTYHEAGHAVVSCHFLIEFENVHVVADGTLFGCLALGPWPSGLDPENDNVWEVRRRLEGRIQETLAGVYAVSRATGQDPDWTEAQHDLDQIETYMGYCTGSAKEATLYQRWQEECTAALVDSQWPSIVKLADELFLRPTLNRSEVLAVITPQPPEIRSTED